MKNGWGTKFNEKLDYRNNKYRKEYNMFGDLKFEGEYLNTMRNGKGKDYSFDGDLKFEGEYLNGKRNGQGKEYHYSEILFEGEYLNDLKWNGKGYNPSKNIVYELKEGKNILNLREIIYMGIK